jgi:hypothetical protein
MSWMASRPELAEGRSICSADRMQLDIVSYCLPGGVGCQCWGAQPSRQREARPVAE